MIREENVKCLKWGIGLCQKCERGGTLSAGIYQPHLPCPHLPLAGAGFGGISFFISPPHLVLLLFMSPLHLPPAWHFVILPLSHLVIFAGVLALSHLPVPQVAIANVAERARAPL